MPRWESVTISQLRMGRSPLTRDTLKRLGLAENDRRPYCAEPDSMQSTRRLSGLANTRGRLPHWRTSSRSQPKNHRILLPCGAHWPTNRRAPAADPPRGPAWCAERSLRGALVEQGCAMQMAGRSREAVSAVTSSPKPSAN